MVCLLEQSVCEHGVLPSRRQLSIANSINTACLLAQSESEREVVRVSMECCLQEGSWNPYYAHLLQRVVSASKAHRITLRYCLWDQFKLVEQTDMRRLVNLAHLTGHLIATFALSLSSLKVSRWLWMLRLTSVCTKRLTINCCCRLE